MVTKYIKFKHPDAVYLLEPLYGLREECPPTQCAKCGGTLYVPIERDDINFTIVRLGGDVIRPFPIEYPKYKIGTETVNWITIQFEKTLRASEVQSHLGVVYAGDGIVELAVDDVSGEYKRCPVCFPEPELKESLCSDLF